MKKFALMFLLSSLAHSSAMANILAPATKLNALLSCQIFANSMPQGQLEMSLSGQTAGQVSKNIKTDSGKFRAEISWGGFFEGTPRNPEIRIQYLSSSAESILVESYKNVDLHRIEKSNDCCDVDNVGLKTADDLIYLSCTYQKK